MISEDEILTILNLFDLEGLLKLGAPLDEYRNEAKMIVERLKNLEISCGINIAHPIFIEQIISDVFYEQFGENKTEYTMNAAGSIWNLLVYKYKKTKGLI